MRVDEKEVERLAEALAPVRFPGCVQWMYLDPVFKEECRKLVRAVVAEVRLPEPSESEIARRLWRI